MAPGAALASPSLRRTLAALVLAGSAATAPAILTAGSSCAASPARAAAERSAAPAAGERERYIQLLRRKDQAERLNTLWKIEAELSAKRTAYAVLDLSERKLLFKVRGRVFKAVSFTGLEASGPSGAVSSEDLAGRAFTLQIKEGKGVETESIQRKALTSDEARSAGRGEGSENEGEPIGAEQGAVQSGSLEAAPGARDAAPGAAPATQKMVGVAGGLIPPDPPRKYHMGFDGLSLWVVADTALPPAAARYESVLSFAKAIGGAFVGSASERSETRITVRLPLKLGQQIFRQLLPGQRLLITL